jgi:predicted nuclease of predicted toxin-antitoxin system
MRFLIDENLGLSYAKSLRAMGYEAAHVSEVNLTSTIDEDIVAYAINNDFIIITFDLDFTRIVALSQKVFPSIITFRMGEITVGEFEIQIIQYLPDLKEVILQGALVTIDNNGMRIKKLPFRKT